MKRFIAVISILLLVFWSFSALGEGIDLSSMSEQELYELDIAIKEELASRDEFSEVILYPGDYSIGSDIPSGDYIIHSLDNNDKQVWVYLVEAGTIDSILTRGVIEPGDNLRFLLEEPNCFRIVNGAVILIER